MSPPWFRGTPASADRSATGRPGYEATRAAAPEREPLTGDMDVDVCVVGGGLAGLTVARELARRGRSVAVLEAGRIGCGASGRHVGVVRPGFAEAIEPIIDRVGARRARELWVLSAAGVEYVRAAIRDEGMPGVDPVDGYLEVSRIDDEERLLRRLEVLRAGLETGVDLWPTEQVREALPSERHFQALHWRDAFSFHPLNYTLGLAAVTERAGARIFEKTRALSVDAAAARKKVATAGGEVRAFNVVLAGGAQASTLFPATADTIVPIAGRLAVTAPLGGVLANTLRYAGAVGEEGIGSDCYRMVEGGRLLWAAGATTRIADPRRLEARMAERIRRAYPQLGPVEIETAWSGIMGYAVHKMPQIGELAPGVWLANAFGRLGVNTSAMAGLLIAGAIADGDDRWRLFASYELVGTGGWAGRAVAEALLWAVRGCDAAARGISQFRASRRQPAEGAAKVAAEAARAEPSAAMRRAVALPPESERAADRRTGAEDAGPDPRQPRSQRVERRTAVAGRKTRVNAPPGGP